MKDYGYKRLDIPKIRYYTNKTPQSVLKMELDIILISVLSIFMLFIIIIAHQNQAYAAPPVLFGPLWKQEANSSNSTAKSDSLNVLFAQANSFLTTKPTSVIDKIQLPASGNRHDFLSLSPYCSPDPTKIGGLPYVCHDGVLNPEVNSIPDHRNMNEMITQVRVLCLAYYFSDNILYASKAAELVRVWFLNNSTRMNPNLQFAEMVPGLYNGTPRGIIAGKDLADIGDSISLVQNTQAWTMQDQKNLELWFKDYLDWLLNSDAGKKEREYANNHGTWYDVQASSIALFLNKTDVARSILETNEPNRIALQIMPDGRQPFELVRQTSLHYSILNLMGLFKLAIIGQHFGLDLWNYQSTEGSGLRKALDYLLPYILKNQTWPYMQILPTETEHDKDVEFLLCQATIHYQKNETYLQAYKSLKKEDVYSSLDNLTYGCANS